MASVGRKPSIKKLKTHFLGGCNFAADKLVPEAFIEERTRAWGTRPDDVHTYYEGVPKTVDDLRQVTCGYCKTKLMNELWFKDWATLTDDEVLFVGYLRHQRNVRKGRTP